MKKENKLFLNNICKENRCLIIFQIILRISQNKKYSYIFLLFDEYKILSKYFFFLFTYEVVNTCKYEDCGCKILIFKRTKTLQQNKQKIKFRKQF